MKITFSKLMSTALVVAFLTSALLINIHPSSSASQYDPWYDINGDGKIDIKDATLIGLAWQAQGDPTRNVNITNWPATWKVISVLKDLNITWGQGEFPQYNWTNPFWGNYSVGGFSRAFIVAKISNSGGPGGPYFGLNINASYKLDDVELAAGSFGLGYYVRPETSLNESIIVAPELCLKMICYAGGNEGIPPGWATVSVAIYLRNE